MKGVFLTEEQVKLMREALDYGRSTMPKYLYDKTISFLTPIEIPKAQIRFLRGRLKFSGAIYSAPFPSMIASGNQRRSEYGFGKYKDGSLA